MPFAPVRNGEIYYEVTGGGPPLILVSGLGGLASFWREQVQAFARRFRVITYDHRGVGRSTHSRIRYTVKQMSDDTISLLDYLDIHAAHYVGHSTGGAIGQIIAQDHPERLASLVLSSTWPGEDPYFRRVFEIRKELLIQQGYESYWRASIVTQRPPRWISENDAYLYTEMLRARSHPPDLEILISRIDAILDFNRRERLGDIHCPTLVTVAADDMLTPPFYAEELAYRIADAELAILGGGGHFAPNIIPDEYNEVVGTFLYAQASL